MLSVLENLFATIKLRNSGIRSDDVTDADDHLIEASASDVDEGCLREARNTVMDEID